MNKSKVAILIAVLSTIIMVLYAQFVLGHFSKCYYIEGGINAFGLTLGYDVNDVQLFLNSRNIQQLNCYKNLILIWDNIFPVLYTLTNILWLRLLYNNKWLILVFPILQMVLDWSENLTQSSLVNQYIESSTIHTELVRLGSILTGAKWTVAAGIYILINIGIITKIVTYYKKV